MPVLRVVACCPTWWSPILLWPHWGQGLMGGGKNEIQRVRSDTTVANPFDTPPEQPLMLDRACCTWTWLFTCCPLRLQKYSTVHCFLTEDACSSALKSPLSVKVLLQPILWNADPFFLKFNNWKLCKNNRTSSADGGYVSQRVDAAWKKLFLIRSSNKMTNFDQWQECADTVFNDCKLSRLCIILRYFRSSSVSRVN